MLGGRGGCVQIYYVMNYNRKIAWLFKDKVRHFRRLLGVKDPDPGVPLD